MDMLTYYGHVKELKNKILPFLKILKILFFFLKI